MKFLYSILILAGVLAFIDAFPSLEADKERLARDKLILAELQRSALNRDVKSSTACTQEYLKDMTDILDIYTTETQKCEDDEANILDVLTTGAKEEIANLKSNVTETCTDKCGSLTEPLDGLDCISVVTSDNSSFLSTLSTKASNLAATLKKNIEDCRSNKDVCDTECMGRHSLRSQAIEKKFKKCETQKDLE